jgi:hypothetical protein
MLRIWKCPKKALSLGWLWVGTQRVEIQMGKKSEKKLGYVEFFSYIRDVIIIDMVNKLKNSFPLIVLGVILGLGVVMLPPALRFFFRGFLLLLENPWEAMCFFSFLFFFTLIWIYTEEKRTKKV